MIDTSKQYTYNGKPVRIYADGSDTAQDYIHGAYLVDTEWNITTFRESDLVEVWKPVVGTLCCFWDNLQHGFLVRKFVKHTKEGYVDSSNVYWVFCAPFKGELPEAFKGLI